VQTAAHRFAAARLLLRQAFALPSCQEFDALAEYLDRSGELPHWRDVAADFGLAPSGQYGLKLALFSRFESQHRLPEALALVAAEPSLLSVSPESLRPGAVTAVRLRALARSEGSYQEVAHLLASSPLARLPGVAADGAALEADRLEAGGDSAGAIAQLEKAASLDPGRWEFARRLAEQHYLAGKAGAARAALARYLALPGSAADREAAFALWDREK
jgi:predicted Zn-dependent protease